MLSLHRFVCLCDGLLPSASELLPAVCIGVGVELQKTCKPRFTFCPPVLAALPSRETNQQQQAFPNLADAKEPVRQAANGVLNACRAAYPPQQLCSSLCPRVLELAPGRARTGLLEFLAVLVPHSSEFFLQGNHPAGGGGHLQSLAQRVAAALVQSPPPANWDGGLGDDGPTSAGSAASAAIRLLTALFRLDRDVFTAASAGLPPDSAAAVRRALSFCRSPSSSPVGKAGAVAGNASPSTAGGRAGSNGAAAAVGYSPVRSPGAVLQEQEVSTNVTPVAGGGRVAFGDGVRESSGGSKERSPPSSPLPPSLQTPPPPPLAAAAVSPEGRGASVSSVPGSAFLCDERDETRRRVEVNPAMFTPPPKEQKPRRQPLAPVTPRDTNRQAGERSGGGGGGTADGCGGFLPADGGKPNSNTMSPAVPARKDVLARATPSPTSINSVVVKVNTEERRAAEAVVVAQRLIAGLSRGARSYQKMEALSSLRRLAEGEGAGGRPEFWPRYFGQVLVLLLDAAAGEGGDGGGGGGLSSSPSRRRMLLRAKNLQGVRCLVARRGELFPECTEVVVGRLVEIGSGIGDACHAVRSEAEACLADLAGVLDPARYLEVLTPLLALRPDDGATDEATAAAAAAGGVVLSELKARLSVKTQCFVLGALRALTPRLSSPTLLSALGAGPLLAGLEAALGGRDLEVRKRAVLALVEMYQVCYLPYLTSYMAGVLFSVLFVLGARLRDMSVVYIRV